MADEVKKLPTIASPRLDGFGGFSDEVEGGEEQVSGRGPPLKFSNEAEWLYNEEALPADLELLAVNVERIVVYWEDEQPNRDKTQTLGPKEPWPDVATLNDATPRDQWREGPDGHLHGPYQRQYVVHFLSMKDMARYWWPTATVGGGICVRDLVERTKWIRAFRGPNTYPTVRLTHMHMRTRFGGRERPHLEIVRWVTLGDDGRALPSPEPGAGEATGDSIPF